MKTIEEVRIFLEILFDGLIEVDQWENVVEFYIAESNRSILSFNREFIISIYNIPPDEIDTICKFLGLPEVREERFITFSSFYLDSDMSKLEYSMMYFS